MHKKFIKLLYIVILTQPIAISTNSVSSDTNMGIGLFAASIITTWCLQDYRRLTVGTHQSTQNYPLVKDNKYNVPQNLTVPQPPMCDIFNSNNPIDNTPSANDTAPSSRKQLSSLKERQRYPRDNRIEPCSYEYSDAALSQIDQIIEHISYPGGYTTKSKEILYTSKNIHDHEEQRLIILQNTEAYKPDCKTTIQSNLANYQAVINVRGDGNCGYRAFWLSALLNNRTNNKGYGHLKTLLQNDFSRLAVQYNTALTYPTKCTEGQPIPEHVQNMLAENVHTNIKNYLITTLTAINQAKNTKNVAKIINKNITCDYYMTMFLRYKIADYIETKATDDDFNFVVCKKKNPTLDDKKAELKNKVLRWQEYIDDLERTLLAKATSIETHVINEQAQQNSLSSTQIENPDIDTHILYTAIPPHYQIIIKKSDNKG